MSEECFFQSDDLEEALSLYKEENRGKIKKLSDFLDNIQTNRKYYRTDTSIMVRWLELF